MSDTRSAYRLHHIRYERRRRRAIANGTWQPWGDIDAVRGHIADLLGAGWTLRAIAIAAGTHPDLVRHVHQGRRKSTTREKADSILAVQPRQRVGWVPADGSRRRLQALAVHGHSVRVVARVTGLEFANLCALRQGERRFTQQRTARILAAVYPRLLATAPGRGAAQARRHAQVHGWHGAAAWNRYTIDDPNARPLARENL